MGRGGREARRGEDRLDPEAHVPLAEVGPERPDADGDDGRTAALLAGLAALRDPRCAACAAPSCGHEYVLSVMLGYKAEPRCLRCLAAAVRQPVAEFRDALHPHVRERHCFRTGWAWASAHEGVADPDHPACLWTPAPVAPVAAAAPARTGGAEAAPTWDAGDLSCGDLVLALRLRMEALPPGTILSLVARDPAAPLDLPAWCRLTGHGLVAADHPHYRIRRKED